MVVKFFQHIKWEAFYEYPKKRMPKVGKLFTELYMYKNITKFLQKFWQDFENFIFYRGNFESGKIKKTEEETLAKNYIKLIHQVTLHVQIYRVSQEERTKLREGVPYVKLYRYNPKHLYPKLNVYGDNDQRSLKL